MQQTAVVVEVPEAEVLVTGWRSRYDPVAVRGVPAHVTVLFPFVAPDDIDHEVEARITEVAAEFEPFAFELGRVEQFPGVVWLRPQPDRPFRRLTQRLWDAFPSHPPYEGRHDDSQPHLTVAMTNGHDHDDLASRIDADIGARLPVRSVARSMAVYANRGDDRWRREHVFPLGAAAGNV